MSSSTTAVRRRMTYRCLVERSTDSGSGGYGRGTGAPTWATHIASLACWVYTSKVTAREGVASTGVRVLETPMLFVPLGTDITEKDRVGPIKKRDGSVYRAGVSRIASVVEVHNHLEVKLESSSG